MNMTVHFSIVLFGGSRRFQLLLLCRLYQCIVVLLVPRSNRLLPHSLLLFCCLRVNLDIRYQSQTAAMTMSDVRLLFISKSITLLPSIGRKRFEAAKNTQNIAAISRSSKPNSTLGRHSSYCASNNFHTPIGIECGSDSPLGRIS